VTDCTASVAACRQPASIPHPRFVVKDSWSKIRGQIRGQTGLVLYEDLAPSLSVYRSFSAPFWLLATIDDKPRRFVALVKRSHIAARARMMST
jgi:hypothetical protein